MSAPGLPVLDRLSRYDVRSRDFTVRELLERRGTSARRDYRWWLPGPTLDQGEEGQCVAEACTDAANGSPGRLSPAVTAYEERRDFYHRAQHDDPWMGCALARDCPIEPSPGQYEGTSVLSGARRGAELGWWREYRWIGAGSGRLEDDVVDTLTRVGGIVFGIPWLEGMYETSVSGLVQVQGARVGGHAIHGWEWAPRQRMPKHWSGTRPGVWWHNSWGPGYGVSRRGVSGCGFVLLEDLLRLLSLDGEGMVPIA